MAPGGWKNRVFGLATCVVVSGLAGCKTDALYARRVPKGPVVTAPARETPRTGEAIDLQLADAGEVDLVESVVQHRSAYHRSLHQLRKFYESRGYATKLAWTEFELGGLKRVKSFRYLTDAEIPADALRASDSIPEADEMYERAVELMRRGGHGVPIAYRQDLMIQAADLFREMIEKHPTSDKIDDAAFMCGEIHKDYLPDQETLAVKWYERSWTWNPSTPHPARFQAAVVYDYRMHDRDRALELYHDVIKFESGQGNALRSNENFAMRRITELTEGPQANRAEIKITRTGEP